VLTRSRLVALIVLLAIGIIVWRLNRRPSSDCVIHATVSIVTRDAPTSRALNIQTDMLMLRNEDGDTWKDVVVAASGFQKIGAEGRRPSGTYVLPPDKLRDKNGLYAIQMNDFEKAEGGSRWVSLTMTAEQFNVKATVNGNTCSVDVTPGTK
jgi:hypothetical protein